jgi:prepilin-type N-terminal cleavage/methylation domain-containing protein
MLSLRLLSDERGFTIVEVMVTTVLLLVGLGAALSMLDGANARIVTTKAREAGTGLVRELAENSRSIPYTRLTPGSIEGQLQARPGLGDEDLSDSVWKIERRDTVYTVTVNVCSVDDPQDGIGEHGSDTYCSDPAPTARVDQNPDDYKRVSLRLDWNRGGAQSVRQTTLVPNESNTTGPRITRMERDPSSDPVTSKTVHQIDFEVETSIRAASVKYAVDGVVKATDEPSSRESRFSWRIGTGVLGDGVPDGTYLVSATAFDAQGRQGATRSLTVRLNRASPDAVQGFVGGWNASRGIVDFDWDLNPESDVRGYRVYRVTAGGPERVCDLADDARATSCADTSPPGGVGPLAYYAVALDENSFTGELREGGPSLPLTVVRGDDQPNPAPSLTARLDDGRVILDWEPSPSIDYPGSTVAFYRIYRADSSLASPGIEDRYDRTTEDNETSFTDFDPGEGRKYYWVSAVDQNYSESVLTGPVTAP